MKKTITLNGKSTKVDFKSTVTETSKDIGTNITYRVYTSQGGKRSFKEYTTNSLSTSTLCYEINEKKYNVEQIITASIDKNKLLNTTMIFKYKGKESKTIKRTIEDILNF